MVKTNINLKVRIKVKNVEVNEYELIMNTWRACMLFFERELRILNDKQKLSKETLLKISHNIDFTELLRTNFLSISDHNRMRLVKLDEVADAIQRIQNPNIVYQSEKLQVIEKENLNYVMNQEKESLDLDQSELEPEISIRIPNTDSNLEKKKNIDEFKVEKMQLNELRMPNIDANEHSKILQRNTASAVVELRKMMYSNLQKIRNTLKEENS